MKIYPVILRMALMGALFSSLAACAQDGGGSAYASRSSLPGVLSSGGTGMTNPGFIFDSNRGAPL
ncbi:hypothetical protein [Roseomonas chloroacetimidivorans]|jgi:hypothetical protein|uniref:hypothetical protein n=1 Tax=Roseomonas chloroacetimidivorans TaxID=1766656 RepID=UPI003C75E821